MFIIDRIGENSVYYSQDRGKESVCHSQDRGKEGVCHSQDRGKESVCHSQDRGKESVCHSQDRGNRVFEGFESVVGQPVLLTLMKLLPLAHWDSCHY